MSPSPSFRPRSPLAQDLGPTSHAPCRPTLPSSLSRRSTSTPSEEPRHVGCTQQPHSCVGRHPLRSGNVEPDRLCYSRNTSRHCRLPARAADTADPSPAATRHVSHPMGATPCPGGVRTVSTGADTPSWRHRLCLGHPQSSLVLEARARSSCQSFGSSRADTGSGHLGPSSSDLVKRR